MASANDETGFDSLLRPLQNMKSHVWDIFLTQALKDYLNQTHVVNFTEAAVVVQNSAGFYSKRVDSVHQFCQQFADRLTEVYNRLIIVRSVYHLLSKAGKENGEFDDQPVKKKRTAKTYISHDFEPVDVTVSDNIYLNLDKIDKNSDRRKIILNKEPKTTRKLNSSCPIYLSTGTEVNLKEEFRLFWSISSNGVLNEDFVFTKNPTFLDWCRLPDEVHDVERNSFIHLDTCNMDIDEQLPDNGLLGDNSISSPPRGPSPDLHNSPPRQNSPLPTENIPVESPVVADPYKVLMFNFNVNHCSLVQKKMFSLPEALIESVNNWKVRHVMKKEAGNNVNYTFDYFNYFKRHVLMEVQSVKMKKSARARQKEIMLRKKHYEKAAKTAAVEDYEDDFEGFDANNEDIGSDLDNALVAINIPEIEPPGKQYPQDNEEIMAAYQENRRRNAAAMTEVARRVQEWHDSLVHVLDMAESRAQFDVHDYGTRIIDSFDQPPEKHPVLEFKNIVKNEARPEISRFLLSSLMLANTYNVEILTPEGHLHKDCLKLKLLSTVRHHEEMDENLAASHH